MPRGVESGVTAPLQARTERAPARVAPLLPNIPLGKDFPYSKERWVRPDRVETANHELNHAIVARSYGMSVLNISVIQEGNTLGRTTFSGGNLHDIAVVAAAGAVDTVHGKASGYGSDKYKAELIHHNYGGHSFDTGKKTAESIIAEYSPDLRRRVSEIIAYLGEVPGAMLPDIIRRAEYEIAMEQYDTSEATKATYVPYQVNSLTHLMTEESDTNRQGQKKFAHIRVREGDELVDKFVVVDDDDEKRRRKELEEDKLSIKPENETPEVVVFDPKTHGKEKEMLLQ